MTKAQVQAIAEKHDVSIDGKHEGAGKFCDLYIGTGSSYQVLANVQSELRDAGIVCHTHIRFVNNDGHKHYGKPYLEIESFWDE